MGAEPAIRVDPDFHEEYPGADALATECCANLVRAADMFMGEHARRLLAAFGISPTAAMVLSSIEGAGGPLTPTEIASRLIVTTASVTSLLDTLEKRRLVRRCPHPRDRRRLLVEVTADGQRVLDRMLPGMHALERRVFDGVSEADKRRFLRLLGQIQLRAAELAAEAPELESGERHKPARLVRSDGEPPT
jgi:DNA-binding MarR family transcriptional regulator